MRKLLLYFCLTVTLFGCASKETQLSANLTKEQISQVVANHRSEIRDCYADLLKKNPKASGRLVLHFVVDPSGQVAQVYIKGRTIASEELGSCVVEKFKAWEFPKALQATEVVQYPIFMNPKK